jgi:hypothetical protein
MGADGEGPQEWTIGRGSSGVELRRGLPWWTIEGEPEEGLLTREVDEQGGSHKSMLRPAYMQSGEIVNQDKKGEGVGQEGSDQTKVEDLLDWFSMPGGESKAQEPLDRVEPTPNKAEEGSEGEVKLTEVAQKDRGNSVPKEPKEPREPKREQKKRKNLEGSQKRAEWKWTN